MTGYTCDIARNERVTGYTCDIARKEWVIGYTSDIARNERVTGCTNDPYSGGFRGGKGGANAPPFGGE